MPESIWPPQLRLCGRPTHPVPSPFGHHTSATLCRRTRLSLLPYMRLWQAVERYGKTKQMCEDLRMQVAATHDAIDELRGDAAVYARERVRVRVRGRQTKRGKEAARARKRVWRLKRGRAQRAHVWRDERGEAAHRVMWLCCDVSATSRARLPPLTSSDFAHSSPARCSSSCSLSRIRWRSSRSRRAFSRRRSASRRRRPTCSR